MSESISSYPLAWPAGWKRTSRSARRRAQFSHGRTQLTVNQAAGRVLAELRRMNVPDWNVIVSTNVPVRRDGLPYSGMREPDDPGAAVYFRKKDSKPADQKCMAIDRYDRVADNLAAIAATIEAMRAIERHGGAEILDRAFTGFTALPAPETLAWWVVLGLDRVRATRAEAEQNFRELAKRHHPDVGGNPADYSRIKLAIDEARAELRT